MLYREIIAVCSETHTNILRGQNMSVKPVVHTRRVQKKTEFFNSAPTSIESALRLLSAPSVRF
jgi:hypothetical protein